MEIQITPEQEARLTSLAAQVQKTPSELVVEAALRVLDEDERFLAFVQEGIDQADRGEFIEEDEMDGRVERMLRR
jgi:predicted transcriptional regulator